MSQNSSGASVIAPGGTASHAEKIGPVPIQRGSYPLGRFASRVRARIDRAMSYIYRRRHPGRFFCRVLELTYPLVARLSPNDSWSLSGHLVYWMKALDAPQLLPLPPRKRIFIYTAYRGQFSMDFMIAILLAWRGHDITLGYLPKLQSPVKEPLADAPSAKPYLNRVLGKVAALSRNRIRCLDLTNEPLEDCALDEAFIQRRVKSDVVMYSRRENFDRSIPEIGQAWDYYERQARNAQRIARSYLKRNRENFDLCVIANGTTFEGTQFCHIAKAIGLPVNTHEKWAFRRVRVMNHGDDFLRLTDLQQTWEQRHALGYTAEPFKSRAARRAFRLLEERRTASKETWSWTLQTSPGQDTDQALQAARVPLDTPFALICPNVPFDAGYDGLLGTFSSLREWLYETVRHLLENTTIHLVVRAHPAEAAHWGGRERSSETLKQFLNHSRLTFVDHDEHVNTYGLMETCKFGVVFSSTTGLEMAMMGKTVVPGANVYYASKGFTVDSQSRSEYEANLTRLAQAPAMPQLSDDQRQDARLFHFVLHYVMQWPFPYDKPNSLLDRPYQKLMRSAEMPRYLPFLDALVLSEPEWRQRIGEFLQADGTNHIPLNEV